MHGNHTGQKIRLAYIVSHPIQYQAPLLRRIAAEPGIDLTVFFSSDFSVRPYRDAGFGTELKWDVDLLSGYKHEFLPRIRDNGSLSPTRPLNYGIFRRLKQGNFDAVWVHGYATVNALHTILAANALGLPVLLRAESWLGDRPRTSRTLYLKKLYLKFIRSFIDATLAIGTFNTQYWRKYFGKDFPIFLMPYAVDNHYFQQRAQAAAPLRNDLCAELDIDPSRPVILFASKLQKRKHCDHLLEAYLRMRPDEGSDPYPYLVIVGDGEQRQTLEQRVRVSGCTSVRFAGFRNQSELPRFFNLASVFVLPSRHEPWGLIVNEAMNAGRAVIVTDEVGSAADLVRNGETGFIYPATNIDELHRVLERALENPEETARIGQCALQRISEWDFEADVRGLLAALYHVTGKKPEKNRHA